MVTLYKKDSNGSIRYISFTNTLDNLRIEHGVLDTENPIVEHVECKPKNVGKKNETTIVEQIEKELNSRVNKKLDQGYKYTIMEAVEFAGTDASGFIKPMLAYEYEKKKHTVEYPVFAQPKFDGIRGTIELTASSCIARSRSGKEINLWPEIKKDLKELFESQPQDKIILDGEFYAHDLQFEVINGVVKNYKNYAPHVPQKVKFIIFDIVDFDCNFTERYLMLEVFRYLGIGSNLTSLDLSETVEVKNYQELIDYLTSCLQKRFEGVMVRSQCGRYESKRSKELLKLKLMQDSEFKIVDVEEAAHQTGVFVCQAEGKIETFKVALKGTHEARQELLKNKEKYIGKMLTVQFQEMTAYGIPRFPVGLRVRDNG